MKIVKIPSTNIFKSQITNIKQITMTQIQNSKHMIDRVYICVKWHIYRQSKLCEAIRTNGGACFGYLDISLSFDCNCVVI